MSVSRGTLPVVSWAGPAEEGAQALRRGSELAARGDHRRAVMEFLQAEEAIRAARYWIEDHAMIEVHREAGRVLGRGG